MQCAEASACSVLRISLLEDRQRRRRRRRGLAGPAALPPDAEAITGTSVTVVCSYQIIILYRFSIVSFFKLRGTRHHPYHGAPQYHP